MIQWAESASAQPLVLAMAEQRREHVHTQLQATGAPLAAAPLKQGSPHKLVLSKPGHLHALDRSTREGWARDLAGLSLE